MQITCAHFDVTQEFRRSYCGNRPQLLNARFEIALTPPRDLHPANALLPGNLLVPPAPSLFDAVAQQDIVSILQLAHSHLGLTRFGRGERSERVAPSDQSMLKETFFTAPGMQCSTRQAVGLVQGEQTLGGAPGLVWQFGGQFGRERGYRDAGSRSGPPLSQRAVIHVRFLGDVAHAARATVPDLVQGLLLEFAEMLISVHEVVLRCKSVKRRLVLQHVSCET